MATAINQIFECSVIWLYICKYNQTVQIENVNCVLIAGIEHWQFYISELLLTQHIGAGGVKNFSF